MKWCVRIEALDEVLTDDSETVGLRCESSRDTLFRCKDATAVVALLSSLHEKAGGDLTVERFDSTKELMHRVDLKRPKNWEIKAVPLPTEPLPPISPGSPTESSSTETGILPVRPRKPTDLIHPVNGLPVIGIPPKFQDTCPVWMRDVVLHHMETVKKYNMWLLLQDRVLIITDTAVYLKQPKGNVVWCCLVAQLVTITINPNQNIVGLHGKLPWDCVFRCADPDALAEMLTTLHRSMQGPGIEATVTSQSVQTLLNLKQPDNYRLDLIPFTKLADLGKSRRHSAAPGTRTHTAKPDKKDEPIHVTSKLEPQPELAVDASKDLPEPEPEPQPPQQTRLVRMTVPEPYTSMYSKLSGIVLFYFGFHEKFVQRKSCWVERVIVITDKAVYAARGSGQVRRCFPVTALSSVRDTDVGLALCCSANYDILLRSERREYTSTFLSILGAVFKEATGGELKVTEPYNSDPLFGLRLRPRPGDAKVEPVRTTLDDGSEGGPIKWMSDLIQPEAEPTVPQAEPVELSSINRSASPKSDYIQMEEAAPAAPQPAPAAKRRGCLSCCFGRKARASNGESSSKPLCEDENPWKVRATRLEE
eukprot:TRINITY_DN8832_c0_g1_i1.p1 TRINITY_DN8832_c0_g1~~TRINITY_DN8832_c0_g1_i1.p1  ORF type:complete len:655 (-),score=81.07 TRINITY_DN8832_c0_g1_i1:9-1778(-)